MKTILAFCLLLLLWVNAAAGDSFPLSTGYVHLELSFDFTEGSMRGSCHMSINNHSDSQVSGIPLLLYRLMKVESVRDENGHKLPFSQKVVQMEGSPKQQVNHIVVNEVLLGGETRSIVIEYSGYLLGYAETGMRYITDRISPEFTLIRNDAYAYPVIGKPDVFFLRNHIPFNHYEHSIKITVPDSLVVANGGIPLGVEQHGNGLATYRYRSKIPNWRIDIAIGPYNVLHSERLNIFYLTDSVAAAALATHGAKTLALYRDWWGELRNDHTLTIIETERGSGGQADETTILMPEEAFTVQDDYSFLYHELSHLWHVSIDEGTGTSPRWEEGLATFCEYLAGERLFPEREGLMKRGANRTVSRLKRDFERNPRLTEIPMIEYGNEQLTRYSYIQPMLMFAVLYHWFGEDTFHSAVGGFYQEYHATRASTRDFTDYWVALTQNDAVSDFFDDWVYGTGYARLVLQEMSIDEITGHYAAKSDQGPK